MIPLLVAGGHSGDENKCGGFWFYHAYYCRSAQRADYFAPGYSYNGLGFRLARSIFP